MRTVCKMSLLAVSGFSTSESIYWKKYAANRKNMEFFISILNISDRKVFKLNTRTRGTVGPDVLNSQEVD